MRPAICRDRWLPAKLVVIYGNGLGGVQSVLFNGVSAPLLYATPSQAGAVVPYAIAGSSVNLAVQSANAASAPVAVAVAATSPGIFTLDSTGRGQAAALNQDGSPNGVNAPAPAGSVISFYATGEGQTKPAGIDGKPAAPPFPEPEAKVKVTDRRGAGRDPLRRRRARPDRGRMQVNVVVPPGLSGTVPVVLNVGDTASQTGVTLMVQ